jgi:hypothetical protein
VGAVEPDEVVEVVELLKMEVDVDRDADESFDEVSWPDVALADDCSEPAARDSVVAADKVGWPFSTMSVEMLFNEEVA